MPKRQSAFFDNPTSEIRLAAFALICAWGALSLLKIWLAGRLDLYSDEVFYWLASTLPAVAYSDLPFMTALWAGLGSALDAGNPSATRALFLAGGAGLPAVVYWLALPWRGRRDALLAALLSICLPLGGFLGLLAVPDVPMLLCGLLALGFLGRALRGGAKVHWLGAGVFLALGLSTHYRFLLYPAAVLLYLLLRNRGMPRSPGLPLVAAFSALGLLPMLWANLAGEMGSAEFYFVERHPWRFSASGLLHLPTQALLVTPPLYALLLYSAWLTFRAARPSPPTDGTAMRGNNEWVYQRAAGDHAELLLWFSLPHLLIYALLAPWADADSTTAHWPLPGYFPLLVFAPEALRRFHAGLRRHWRATTAALATLAIPAVGFCGGLLALAGIGSQSFQAQLQPFLGSGVLSEKMAGWGEFADYTQDLLDEDFEDGAAVATDNYPTAAQLLYAGVLAEVYTLDTDKAVRDGRLAQLRRWGMTGEFIRERRGEPLLFITEDSALNIEQKNALIARACGLADEIRQIGQLSLFGGDKRFGFYQGRKITAQDAPAATPCPYPPRAWIDRPEPGAALSGIEEIGGWAYHQDLGVAAVRVYLDGRRIAEAEYGLPRPDVVAARRLRDEPNQPNLGFRATINTGEFTPGRHELAVEIIDDYGTATMYGRRTVVIRNP